MSNLYDKATEKLVKQVKNMTLPPEFHTKYDMGNMVKKFRAAFKNTDLRSKVLLQKYELQRISQKNYSAGFCGIASYTWNHLFRMPDGAEVWRIKMISSDSYDICSHVWLENQFTGDALDLTFDQFIDSKGQYVKIPYNSIGKYVNSYFEFERAYEFANHLGIDLSMIVFENTLYSLKSR